MIRTFNKTRKEERERKAEIETRQKKKDMRNIRI
jgi:hypothetical protein